jgi:zinc/manganese transport system substrate-binding protein
MNFSIPAAMMATVITLTSPALAQDKPVKLVASFSIIADFARNVGGDRVDIATLVGPDGDAHVYEASPADAAKVAGADLVLVNGLGLEGFLPRLIEASATKAPVVEVTRGATLIEGSEEGHHHHGEEAGDKAGADHHGHDHGAHDPHAWQSIPNAEIYVANIADALCSVDSEGCATYRSNAEGYVAELKALDTEVRAAVASIPQDRRTIITSHDAFGYFAHEYGLSFLAPEGISTEAEASAADVAALIRQVREDKASAIFVENISDPRLAERIAGETGLKIGGELYSDALSGPDGPASTYIDMMHHNVATIRNAIVGS